MVVINEFGEIIRDEIPGGKMSDDDNLLAEYRILERKVLRVSGSVATPDETARYEELKKKFSEQDIAQNIALAKKLKDEKNKIKPDNSALFARIAQFKKENE